MTMIDKSDLIRIVTAQKAPMNVIVSRNGNFELTFTAEGLRAPFEDRIRQLTGLADELRSKGQNVEVRGGFFNGQNQFINQLQLWVNKEKQERVSQAKQIEDAVAKGIAAYKAAEEAARKAETTSEGEKPAEKVEEKPAETPAVF